MDEDYIPYSIRLLILITSIIATIKWNKYKTSTERNFVFFLWITFIFECIAAFSKHQLGTNFWVYNTYSIFSFIFYLNWFYSIVKSPYIKYLFYIFIGVILFNIVIEDFIFEHQIYTFITGAISLLICSFFYYSNLLKGNEVFIIKQKLSFWIATGILLFHVGMIPLIVLGGVLDFTGKYYLLVLASLNLILYGCYIIGFLWTKKIFNR